ncbi:MAG TPA: DNA polymerase III subunit gamma and tau [Streptosporangiaceae bacterium]|nr:DNA polymerase III subunit gamma and tau [Streptosporangiaceae bacterium]
MAASASEREGTTPASLALYRKYRPATFAEVKGQEHVTGPLRQALLTGRISHAYLFSGPRGCGKTSSARILARSLNCVNGPTPDPCGVCDSCVALAPSGPGSIDVIEIDAASHGGVDDARELRERAFYTPVSGRFKIYIIDEAHMVTQQGFNALLKLVEEPPPHLKFIFATTEPDKVIATIRSRTHHYPFRLVPPSVLRELMQDIVRKEGVEVDEAVLPLVVRAGAGSVRDSLSILDQLLAGSDETGLSYAKAVALLGYTDASLLDEIVDAFAAGNGAAVFGVVNRVIEGGHEPRRFAADLLDRFRDLIVLAAVPDAAETGLLDLPQDRAERMAAQAGRFGQAGLARAAEIVSTGLDQMRGATSPRLLLELMCAQVLLPAAATDEKSLLARLERLEHTDRARPAAPRPQAPAPPPHSGTDHEAERTRGATSGKPQAPIPPRPAAPGQPAREQPASGQAARQQAAREQAVSPAAGTDASASDVLRRNWDAVLEAVKRERRVAWILLSNASVVSVDDNILTLRFAGEGELKRFSTSDYDADLKRVLSTGFGLNVMVKGVVGGGAGVTSASPGPSRQPENAAPAVVRSVAGPPEFAGFDEEPPDDGAPDDVPDEPSADDAASGPAELTGMDLIQRELGGRVISEIED